MRELVDPIDGFQAQGFALNVDVVDHDSLDGNEARIIAQRLKHRCGCRDRRVTPVAAINRMLQLRYGMIVFFGELQVFRVLEHECPVIDALV